MISSRFTAAIRPIVVALLLQTAVSHASPATKDVTLVGTASDRTEQAVRGALRSRRVRLVAPAGSDGQISDGAPASGETARRAEQLLAAAKDLYYAVKPLEAATLLDKKIPQLSSELALADRFDLLRRLHLWQGVCHVKGGIVVAGARAFASAIQIDDRGLDRARFDPSVIEAFDAARTQAASRPRGSLALVLTPSTATVVVDGRPIRSSDWKDIRLGYGQHWVLLKAVGFASVVRRVDLQQERLRLELELKPAPPATLARQIEQLRAEGRLDVARSDVASALGRLQRTDEVLIVDERRVGGKLALALVRVQSVDGRVLARTETVVNPRDRAPAVRRAVGVLWPAPAAAKRSRPLYKRWWVWTAVGLAVVGAVAITLVATSPPDTYTIKIGP